MVPRLLHSARHQACSPLVVSRPLTTTFSPQPGTPRRRLGRCRLSKPVVNAMLPFSHPFTAPLLVIAS
jgi:hypothetical protein